MSKNKKRYIIFFSIYFLLNTSFGQENPSLIYCFSEDSVKIEKINEYIIGDTIVSLYTEDFSNSEYFVYQKNDTIYTKYNNSFYFLGSNFANIGDLWHPLRYRFMSFTDSSDLCQNLMNLEVVGITQVPNSDPILNSIQLKDLDLDNVYYQYIENIGVVDGGPFYNFKQQYFCDIIFDLVEPTPLYYFDGVDTLFFITECSGLGFGCAINNWTVS